MRDWYTPFCRAEVLLILRADQLLARFDVANLLLASASGLIY